MKLLLLNIPLVDFTLPSLGIPTLVSYIKHYSRHIVKQYDLNIELFDKLLDKSILEQALKHTRTNNSIIENKINDFSVYRKLPNIINGAKEILRNQNDFYKFDRYLLAMNTIRLSIKLINYSIFPFEITEDFSFYVDSEDPNASIKKITKYITMFEELEFNPIKNILDKELKKVIKLFQPDVVGLSNVYNSQDFFTKYIVKFIKKKFSDIKVIVGGTANSERFSLIKDNADKQSIYEKYFFKADYFIVNEGEKALLDLLDYLDSFNKNLSEINNLIYFDYKTGDFKKNKRIILKDLNKLPAPEFDKKILKKYFSPEIVFPIAPTRGCYWGKCTFCSYGFTEKNRSAAKYREVSPEKLVSDLKEMEENYGAKLFLFSCDVILPDTGEIYAKEILKKNIDIRWSSDFRMEKTLLKEDRIKALRQSGLIYVCFGMEIYSQGVLNKMNKGLNNKYFSEILKRVSENDIAVDLMLFSNFPTETTEDYKKTLRFLLDNKDYIHKPIIMASFVLLANSYVAKHPSEFGIKIIENKNNYSFNLDILKYKLIKNNEKKKYDTILEKLEDTVLNSVQMGDRPWVNANQAAHTFLYVNKFNKEILRKIDEFYGKIQFIVLNYLLEG